MDCANFRFDHVSGPVFGHFSEKGLDGLLLPRPDAPVPCLCGPASNTVWGEALRTALTRYFAGVPEDFRAVPLDLSAGTAFRRRVWEAAREIGWGETIGYGELARRIGLPGAARAVGQALGANPVPIVVPCHRILAADGGLGGFGAGLEWKRTLLGLEGIGLA